VPAASNRRKKKVGEQSNMPAKAKAGEQTSAPAKAGEMRPRRRELLDALEAMQAEMNRHWGGTLPDWAFVRPLRRLAQLPWAGMPRTDVYDRGGVLVVKVELPGVNKEDVDLTVEGGDLVLRAERKEEKEVKEGEYYRMERQFGGLYRRLPLPEGVQTDRIAATLKDGVLEISIPRPATPAQKIPVQ
jgi:HSP20 family protein